MISPAQCFPVPKDHRVIIAMFLKILVRFLAFFVGIITSEAFESEKLRKWDGFILRVVDGRRSLGNCGNLLVRKVLELYERFFFPNFGQRASSSYAHINY